MDSKVFVLGRGIFPRESDLKTNGAKLLFIDNNNQNIVLINNSRTTWLAKIVT